MSWLERVHSCTKHGAKIKREYDIYPFVHFITLFSYTSVQQIIIFPKNRSIFLEVARTSRHYLEIYIYLKFFHKIFLISVTKLLRNKIHSANDFSRCPRWQRHFAQPVCFAILMRASFCLVEGLCRQWLSVHPPCCQDRQEETTLRTACPPLRLQRKIQREQRGVSVEIIRTGLS